MTRAAVIVFFASALAIFAVQTRAVELDPKVLVYKLPDQINWGPVTPAGNQQAVLFGDPNKPGLYGVMVKWLAAIISAGRISIPMIGSSQCCPGRGGWAAGLISIQILAA